MTPLEEVQETQRPFQPGTTGWTASDLDDPAIERQWMRGSYEIVEGVLAIMPAAYFRGGTALSNLLYRLHVHLDEIRSQGKLSIEVDLVLSPTRVVKADAVFLTPEDEKLQAAAAAQQGRTDPLKTRILVPPTLVIESVSPGHETHDRRTKRAWYAEAGVPGYWILDAFEESLECLVLDHGKYRLDVAARHQESVRPSAFPGLTIALPAIWGA